MKKPNKNAKDPHWQVPVDLPGVKPEDYPKVRPSPAENAGKPRPDNGPPDYTLPGHPSSKETAKP